MSVSNILALNIIMLLTSHYEENIPKVLINFNYSRAYEASEKKVPPLKECLIPVNQTLFCRALQPRDLSNFMTLLLFL